jgi:hypothetical protein
VFFALGLPSSVATIISEDYLVEIACHSQRIEAVKHTTDRSARNLFFAAKIRLLRPYHLFLQLETHFDLPCEQSTRVCDHCKLWHECIHDIMALSMVLVHGTTSQCNPGPRETPKLQEESPHTSTGARAEVDFARKMYGAVSNRVPKTARFWRYRQMVSFFFVFVAWSRNFNEGIP